jgi:transposase
MAKDYDKFIELTAMGLSYDKISKQLKVSKSTLIEWSKVFEPGIRHLRNIKLEPCEKN